MKHVRLTTEGDLILLELARGKVNAINEELVLELAGWFDSVEGDPLARAVVLTGRGPFFTFGFDIPEFLSWEKADFIRYLQSFTALYTRIWTYPKPVVAALNGHTIAGGCMISLACDRSVMARGKAKIALNEVDFGASLVAGAVEMLVAKVGQRHAEEIAFEGAMFDADQALGMGLVDRAVAPEDVLEVAKAEAHRLAGRDAVAYLSIKRLLREPVAERMRAREPASILDFADIWYSPETRERLKKITIRG